MPYDLKTKSGIILRNIPDEVSPDAPELKELVQQQLSARAPKKQPAPIMPSDPGEAARMAAEGMGWGEKALVNLGAGFDTALQGAQQIGGKLGIGQGVSDDEIREKRERDEQLAEQTTGGSLLQIAGEAAPTMAVPFGTFARGAAGAARAAGATRAAGALGQGTTRAIADSALAGAAGASLGPTTEDESRLLKAGVGGTLGAALPAAGRLANVGREAFTQSGAANRAARLAREAVGDDPNALRNLARYDMDRPEIPLTAAAAAESPGLARLEAGYRARDGSQFYDVDQTQGRAVARAVMRDTGEAGELEARRGARRAAWEGGWQRASEGADPEIFAQQMGQFRPNLTQALRSTEASNPAVRGVVDSILGEMDRLGDDFGPGHLQQIRANLNARGKPLPANAYESAPRDSAAVNSIITEIDDILNATTDNAWDSVRRGYATGSREVDASKAAGRVRETFLDETGRVRGTALDPRGDVPLITEAGLGRGLDRALGRDKRNQLSAPATQGLNRTLESLRRQGIVQRVKKSATAGGGSNTASDAMAIAATEAVMPGGGLARLGIQQGFKLANRGRDAALVEALRDPAAMTQLLTRAVQAPGELTGQERALLQALRSMGAIGAADVMQQQ